MIFVGSLRFSNRKKIAIETLIVISSYYFLSDKKKNRLGPINCNRQLLINNPIRIPGRTRIIENYDILAF